MKPKQLRAIAQQLLELADALDKHPLPTTSPEATMNQEKAEPKTPMDRVLDAFQRAPSYAWKYPGFSKFLNGHALTRTQIRRAIGNGPEAADVVREGLEEGLRLKKIKRLEINLKMQGRKPEVFVLAEFVHLFDEQKVADSALPAPKPEPNDPFSNEWVPPWRLNT